MELRSRHRAVSGTALRPGVVARMTGPGALYNIGNLLALIAGAGLTVSERWGQSSIWETLYAHFIGTTATACLTLAMILFLISGAIYDRARDPMAPVSRLQWADFLSGLAAIALTLSLMQVGEALSALVAGSMLTLGKLGSAALPFLGRADRFDAVFRLTVVASRAPSLMALGLVVFPALIGAVPMDAVAMPAIMIVCFLLWLWADLLLLRS